MKIWFQNRRMKWKRTKKGPKESKDGRGGEMNEEEEEEEDSKLEIDESDPEDNNNIQVDGGDEGLMVSEDIQQSECEFNFLPDEIVEVSTGLRESEKALTSALSVLKVLYETCLQN